MGARKNLVVHYTFEVKLVDCCSNYYFPNKNNDVLDQKTCEC